MTGGASSAHRGPVAVIDGRSCHCSTSTSESSAARYAVEIHSSTPHS